jgi:hypothetical protein
MYDGAINLAGDEMKTGDRVIWLYCKKRSFVTGWRRQEIPGVIVRVCRRRIRIRVKMGGREKVVNVDPENVICMDEVNGMLRLDCSAI